MSSWRLIQSARQRYQQLSVEKKLLILHPQFRYHNALIDALLEEAETEALFVTAPKPGVDLKALWAEFTQQLATAYDLALPELSSPDPAKAAKTLVKTLAAVAPLTIVLEAYDYVTESVHPFIAELVKQTPKQTRIFLSSRTWHTDLISMLPSPETADILPVSADDMLLDYLSRDEGRVLLEVHALGSGQVLIDGRMITQWDGALPRALFFYFIDRGMTTRDEVFTTFWPELSTREATNVFHVTKRKISEILGVDLTVYSSGFYRISPDIDLHYDVVSFAEAVQNSAVAEDSEAEALLDQAIGLHEREFLSAFEQAWALKRRDELRRTYVDALTALARIYESRKMYTQALGLYNRAFGAFPQREDLARAQMRLYEQENQPERALIVYDRLVSELSNSLGVEPSPETVSLAEQLHQNIN